ncbi:efflux RND transporter permease subunit [Mesorhizobium sp. BR1-1-16]|uniref:efflux RND transporter permease subunit n=1 Tax=Mesorhizobium sp. BR1-1-16 TaxID=2876653 RepID=UPI001CCF9D12|nr:efflux RND transporter permease subunit [Mesorhizobium sp. BR1-1-16]MBZ9935889.1 efflux RND transporter permease subunit [Mesorhizobium sp. BR1-1-16]
MNWNFSAWAIRNPVPPILLFVVLIALGLYSFAHLPITKFPNIDVPVIAVTVTDVGSAPAELETQVTKKVEDAIAGISGVKHVTSTVTDGSSTTAVEFRLEINTDRALNDVKDAIAKIRGDLPGSIDEPIVQRIDVEGQSIQSYAVTAPTLTPEELSWFVDDTVIRDLQGLKGVGRVERMGGVTREIQVRLDPDRLMALGVTAAEVSRQLKATNVDLSGGKAEVGGQEQTIRTLANAMNLDQLAATRIVLSGGREVRLSDLGTVVDGYQEPKSYARLDGKPVVAFAIYRAKGASDASVSDVVKAEVAALQASHPDIGFSRIDDSVYYTYGNYESAMDTLVEGALLAILVVLLFLRDIRATLIAAVALPLSAIPTFWALSMLGFSLNLISLLGITLVTGILVDDAIVEIENIVRHIRMGKKPYKAALEAADEIGLAVIAISATIIAIFAPVSFMGGVAGQYFKQFGLTVAIAVFFSLLVARLITPMMAAFFMREPYAGDGSDGRKVYRGAWPTFRRRVGALAVIGVLFLAVLMLAESAGPAAAWWAPLASLDALAARLAAHGWALVIGGTLAAVLIIAGFTTWLGRPHPEEHEDGFIMRLYTGLLRATLWRPRIRVPFATRVEDGVKRPVRLRVPVMPLVTIAAGIAFFLVSMNATQYLPTGFIPPVDEGRIVTSVELPPGARLDETTRVSDAISAKLGKIDGVESVFVMGGTSPTGTLEKRRATVILNLTPKESGRPSQKDLQFVVQDTLAGIPDIRAFFMNERGDREATVGILGRDGDAVAAAASNLEAEMRKDPIFSNPAAQASFARPEIRISPKADQAADLGISTSAISETVRVATMGDADSQLAKFTVGDRQIPIRVELKEGSRGDLSLLSALRVPTGSGGSVPLSTVANIGFGQGPSTIERYDRERLVKVGTDMAPGYTSGQGLDRIKALPAVKDFPAGVRIQDTGDAEIQGEVFSGFAVAMGAGIMMVFVVLILLFNSVIQPITILASLPLSVGGVVAALLLTNNALSMPVIIGILMLMGIVTKNAIMLVDFAVEREKHGMEQTEAVIDAGRKRARPIVMTTIAMAAGMLPAAYGVGQGGEFRSPMAIAVIGGLLVSTVLSLVFIPSVYSVMDDVSRGISGLFHWIVKPNSREESGNETGDAPPPVAHSSEPTAAEHAAAMRIAAE